MSQAQAQAQLFVLQDLDSVLLDDTKDVKAIDNHGRVDKCRLAYTH